MTARPNNILDLKEVLVCGAWQVIPIFVVALSCADGAFRVTEDFLKLCIDVTSERRWLWDCQTEGGLEVKNVDGSWSKID